MNKLEPITGEWIKKELNEAISIFQKEKDIKNNTFTYNPPAKVFNERVKYLRSICPHKYDSSTNICIYCGQSSEEKK